MKSAIGWFSIPTNDLNRAVKFYSAVLATEINISDFEGETLGFFPMEEDGIGGDLSSPSETNAPSKTGTRVFFTVEGRLDEALKIAAESGGKLLGEKFPIGDMGWIGFIEDTEGNVVGLHSSK